MSLDGGEVGFEDGRYMGSRLQQALDHVGGDAFADRGVGDWSARAGAGRLLCRWLGRSRELAERFCWTRALGATSSLVTPAMRCVSEYVVDGDAAAFACPMPLRIEAAP